MKWTAIGEAERAGEVAQLPVATGGGVHRAADDLQLAVAPAVPQTPERANRDLLLFPAHQAADDHEPPCILGNALDRCLDGASVDAVVDPIDLPARRPPERAGDEVGDRHQPVRQRRQDERDQDALQPQKTRAVEGGVEMADQAPVEPACGQPGDREGVVGVGVDDLARRALEAASHAGIGATEARQPAQPEERQQQRMARMTEGDLAAADDHRSARGPQRLRTVAVLDREVAKADPGRLRMPELRQEQGPDAEVLDPGDDHDHLPQGRAVAGVVVRHLETSGI